MADKTPETELDQLEPIAGEKSGAPTLNFLAQFTERPDLLIDALERHDPGFTQRLNAKAFEVAQTQQVDQGTFAKRNAYFTMGLTGLIVVALLALMAIAVVHGSTMILVVLGLILITIVGGAGGWSKIVSGISEAISRVRAPKK